MAVGRRRDGKDRTKKGDGRKGGGAWRHDAAASAARSLPHQKIERSQLKKSERKKQRNQDLLEIDNDYRLLKKLKRGKITETEYMRLADGGMR